MDTPSENFPALPFEIVVTILMMLPAEVLVRFMLVCKEWRDLIKDADFIYKHFQFSASRGNNYLFGDPSYSTSSVLLTDKSHVKSFERKVQLDFHSYAACSSNGLVLLSNYPVTLGTTTYLYNPFIQRLKSIPSTSTELERVNDKVRNKAIGFGYLSQSNDYRIVKIALINEETEVEIYSLRSDSWRRVEVGDFPWEICTNRNGAQVNDSLHWQAFVSDPEYVGVYPHYACFVMLVFDLAREIFQVLELPKHQIDADADDCYEDAIAYKDKLCLIVHYHVRFIEERYSLWMMREYGVSDSWALLFNIVLREGVPLSLTKHDEFIFVDENDNVGVENLFNHQRQYLDFSDIYPNGFWVTFFPVTNSLSLLEA